jgi:hypothetical protein
MLGKGDFDRGNRSPEDLVSERQRELLAFK